MMLNCVFGGDGVGFINLIQYVIASAVYSESRPRRLF